MIAWMMILREVVSWVGHLGARAPIGCKVGAADRHANRYANLGGVIIGCFDSPSRRVLPTRDNQLDNLGMFTSLFTQLFILCGYKLEHRSSVSP